MTWLLVGLALAGCSAATIPPAPSIVTPSPTPTPDPAVWRFEGTVRDEEGRALEGVCVVIGPHGCQPHSPHTDAFGRYYLDVPRIPTVVYDLTFVKEGYEPVSHRAQPSEPTVFDVVLRSQGR